MRADLSPEAARDLRAVLRASRAFGALQARAMAVRLRTRLDRIADGEGHGHVHPDLATKRRILCATVSPILIFYDRDTRRVLRIVDGRRDLPPLLAEFP